MLTILYRSCDKEIKNLSRAGRPSWFNKLNCFKSIHNSIQKSQYKNSIKLITIMDGKPSELSEYIKSLNYEIYFCEKYSNLESLKFVLEFSKQFKSNDIYFIEDDYLHLDTAIDCLYTGVSSFGLVTGYDHMDRYTRNDDICKSNESIYYTNNRHWRTCESTTCSWAVSSGLYDTVISAAEHFLLNDRDLFRYLYTKNIRLHSPVPGVTTHIHEPYMSPGIDWEKINNSIYIQ